MPAVDLLITGARGQLGRAVVAACGERALSVLPVGSGEMPLEDRAAIGRVVDQAAPRCILHLAAMTNVDGCQTDPLAAYRINALGTAWLAEAALRHSAHLVYVSTDFVFDGAQVGTPYAVDAAPRPLSHYGASKLLGEDAVLATKDSFHVVRTSWVFGPGGRNFPRAILDRARAGQPLQVVTDQVGRPTFTLDLADALLDLWRLLPAGGVYHAANEGLCSWHQFAVDILSAAGLGHVEVKEQLAASLQRPAPRPAWSVLDTSRLTAVRGAMMPHYRTTLPRYLAAEQSAPAPAPAPAAGGARRKQY